MGLKLKWTIAAVLAAGLVVSAGCGDDDDDETSTTTEAPTDDGSSEEGEEAAGSEEFCTSWIALNAGDPTPEAIRETAALAPPEAADALESIATGFEEEGEAFFQSPDFGESFATAGQAANEECADESLDIVAVDYGYEGIPEEISAGQVGVDFSNEGAELHELLILRKNDGVEQSFDELFALGEEEAGALVTEVGGSFALPGEASATLLDLTTPGEYVAVCFIPVGTTPDAGEEGGSGPPHFAEGMKAEFTVS